MRRADRSVQFMRGMPPDPVIAAQRIAIANNE
jgi:hypothetical protein